MTLRILRNNEVQEVGDPQPVTIKTTGDGEGGNMGGMEARLSEVEKAIVRIDAVLPTLATKSEVQQGFGEMVKWIVGTAFAGMATFITVMTFVLNNATPKAAPAAPAAQSPTIIYLPATPPAPAPAASKP